MLKKYPIGLVLILLTASSLLSACAPTAAAANTQQPETSTPMAVPTLLPATSVPVLTPTSGAPILPEGADMASVAAKDALVQQLALDPAMLSLSSATAMQWPDSCLGVQPASQMCATHVVPGFRFILKSGDAPYEVRTNQDGSQVVVVPEIVIQWQADQHCQSAVLTGENGIAVGECMQPADQPKPFPSTLEASDLNNFTTSYATFHADTAAGSIRFVGMGAETASPSEQRMIAEWARSIVDQTLGGGNAAASGLVLAWHRQGGVAGFCNDLQIYITGEADASSCANEQTQNQGRQFLNSEQLDSLYGWVDSLKSFDAVYSDTATTDVLSTHLVFTGTGGQEATAQQKQTINDYAGKVYSQMNLGQTQPISSSLPAQVVSDFLTAVQQDPSGGTSLKYLSPPLLAEIESGNLLSTIMGVQNHFRSFAISEVQIDPNETRAVVTASLNFASPIQRDFELVKYEDVWQITSIIAFAVPPLVVSPEDLKASHVILDYTWALQNHDAQTAWSLLTPDAQAPRTEADLALEAQGVGQISATSITLLSADSGRQVYAATFWVTPNDQNQSDWKAGSNQRWIELDLTDAGWRINQIADTPIE